MLWHAYWQITTEISKDHGHFTIKVWIQIDPEDEV
jgi:hypothetical protein